MYKIIIQHGSFGSPSSNWFPWLKEKVSGLGYQCITPQLPINNKQSLNSWIREFSKQVPNIDSQTILIGHSLTPAFFMSLLEKKKTKVLATFLVSGFLRKLGLPDFDRVNATFVAKKHDWKLIRKLSGKVYFYGSTNDPYVPFQFQKEFAEKLGTKIILIKNGGHLNSESGFSKFPLLYEDLRSFLCSFK